MCRSEATLDGSFFRGLCFFARECDSLPLSTGCRLLLTRQDAAGELQTNVCALQGPVSSLLKPLDTPPLFEGTEHLVAHCTGPVQLSRNATSAEDVALLLFRAKRLSAECLALLSQNWCVPHTCTLA